MTSEDNTTAVLFFHEESPACQKLKQHIPKDTKINYVNVAQVSNIPQSITSIPALIINNKDILLGKKVFDYFNKSDDMEYLCLTNKTSPCIFSTIESDDNPDDSSSMFSSINEKSMNEGVPEWNEESSKNNSLDLDKLQSERSEMFKLNDKKQI